MGWLTASRNWLATRSSRLAGIDPEVLRYASLGLPVGPLVRLAGRRGRTGVPPRIPGGPHQWYFLLPHVPLVLCNGFLHYWLLSKRPVTWHWLVALSAMDIALNQRRPC